MDDAPQNNQDNQDSQNSRSQDIRKITDLLNQMNDIMVRGIPSCDLLKKMTGILQYVDVDIMTVKSLAEVLLKRANENKSICPPDLLANPNNTIEDLDHSISFAQHTRNRVNTMRDELCTVLEVFSRMEKYLQEEKDGMTP